MPKHPKNITNTDRSRFREFINLVGDELGHKRAFELYHNDAGDNFNTAVQVVTTTGLLDSNDAIFPLAMLFVALSSLLRRLSLEFRSDCIRRHLKLSTRNRYHG